MSCAGAVSGKKRVLQYRRVVKIIRDVQGWAKEIHRHEWGIGKMCQKPQPIVKIVLDNTGYSL